VVGQVRTPPITQATVADSTTRILEQQAQATAMGRLATRLPLNREATRFSTARTAVRPKIN
jgi:hypothetical protein